MICDMSSHGATIFVQCAKKVVGGRDRGEARLAELAVRFGVSRGWAWKISSARERSEVVERQSCRRSSRSRLDRQVLALSSAEHPDLTLRQLRFALNEQTGFRSALRTCIYNRKGYIFGLKSCSTPRSGTQKKTESGVARSLKTVRTISPERSIYMDESGATTAMARLCRTQPGRGTYP